MVQAKWHPVEKHVKAIRSLLVELHETAKYLPEDKTANTLPVEAESLLEYGERVLHHPTFWGMVPDVLIPTEAEITSFRSEMLLMNERSETENLSAEEIEAQVQRYAEGMLRRDAQHILALCLRACRNSNEPP